MSNIPPGPGYPPPAPPKRGMPVWLIVLIVVLLIVLLGCCGGIATCVYATRRGVQAAQETMGITVGSLPASFPKDVPVYSGFTPSFAMAPAGQDNGVVTFTGKGDAAKISDFYEQTLADNGWKETSSNTSTDGWQGTYTKGNRELSIQTTKEGADTNLIITWGKKDADTPEQPADQTPVTPATPVTPTTPTTPRTPARTPGNNVPPPPGDDGEPAAARPANNPAATPSTPPAPAGAAARLPANFPADIPVFTGLTPGFSFADRAKGSGSVMFSGKIDKAKALAFYEKELAAKGWKQEQNTDIGAGSVLVYSKDGRKLSMTIIPDEDKGETMVTMSYEKE